MQPVSLRIVRPEWLEPGDDLELANLTTQLEAGQDRFEIVNHTRNRRFPVRLELGERHRQILLAGGLLNFVRQQALTAAS